MAANTSNDSKEYNPFDFSSETRMMQRSIPYFHLPGYQSMPNVLGARAKVDSHNTRYQRRPRSKSTESYAKGVASFKTDYSHVASKIDTGRQKFVRSKSATTSDPVALSPLRRKMAQLKRLMTQPHINFSSTTSEGDSGSNFGSRSRKISAPTDSKQLKKQIRPRVDCTDPHPDVTKLTHSLEELQIVRDLNKEDLNPRFNLSAKSRANSVKSRKLCLPADFERSSNRRNTGGGQVKPQQRVTITSVSSAATREIDRPAAVCGAKISRVVTSGEQKKMEDGDIVKMKSGSAQMQYAGIFQSDYQSHEHVSNRVTRAPVGHNVRDDPSLRDSVSSSESVGINPEYNSMEPDMDAFSVDSEQVKLDGQGGDWEENMTTTACDKIVGFEVSTDTTQTTVNLLHLLGRKNRSVEQTETEYRDHKLWVIGEEQEEESEEEMEEEIYLSDGASCGDPETITLTTQPVPQLFVVDENDTVVEKIKTGRRKQSRSSVSDSHIPPGPETLSLHTLTLHDAKS